MHEFILVSDLGAKHFGQDVTILSRNSDTIIKRKFFGVCHGTDSRYPIDVMLEDEGLSGTFFVVHCHTEDCCLVEM